MNLLAHIRTQLTRSRGEPYAAATSAESGESPFPGYEGLDGHDLGARLSGLDQVELAAVEAYERSHRDRPEVLAKLRYLRTMEPLPGYDALDEEGVARALAGADTGTVKRVRDYERKFQRRHAVLDEITRVLPDSQANAEETQARERQTALIRKGFAGRAKTAGRLAGKRDDA